MNAKDKATDVLSKMYRVVDRNIVGFGRNGSAKECALVCIDEIIEVVEEIEPVRSDWKHFYWKDVRNEIEKL